MKKNKVEDGRKEVRNKIFRERRERQIEKKKVTEKERRTNEIMLLGRRKQEKKEESK